MWSLIVPCGPKTHWVARARYDLRKTSHSLAHYSINQLTPCRWVVADDSKLWTASGVSSGTDAMLALIDHIYGKNDQGVFYGDLIGDGMEWNRVHDSGDDPFAVKLGVEDVVPQ
jgi:hypothetical protein